jgi:long-subunit acyl-CoA synthetase (AMP-forming)
VFHEIAARLGGEVVVILSGAAPLDSKVLHFLRAAFSTVAMQAYGQVF